MPTDDAADNTSGDPLDDVAEEIQFRIALAADLAAVHDVFVASSAGPGHPPEGAVAAGGPRLGRLPARPTGGRYGSRAGRTRVLGFLLLSGRWLNLLFVHPDRPARGVGAALMELVKGLRPQGFGLRVYRANTRAREFYRRHGLIELEGTDGSSYSDGAARPPDGVAR